MTSSRAQHRRHFAAAAALLLTLICFVSPVAAAQSPPHDPDALRSVAWTWPTDSHRVLVPYRAPATRYGAGHRGIDLSAAVGSPVSAPAAGVVAFAGAVADRPVLTIDHGAGLVSTLEPVRSELSVGAVVRAGVTVGVVATGGHAAPDTVHLGVRRDGAYINPLLLLGGIPHAVLLPCCS